MGGKRVILPYRKRDFTKEEIEIFKEISISEMFLQHKET